MAKGVPEGRKREMGQHSCHELGLQCAKLLSLRVIVFGIERMFLFVFLSIKTLCLSLKRVGGLLIIISISNTNHPISGADQSGSTHFGDSRLHRSAHGRADCHLISWQGLAILPTSAAHSSLTPFVSRI